MKSVKFNLDGDEKGEEADGDDDNEKTETMGEPLESTLSLEKTPLLSKDKTDKLPYPKAVFFMFLTELGERYSYYGMINILALFLRNVLLYSENVSTVIYHIFGMLAYTTPVIGSIFADSVLGKYKTVVYFGVIHTIGSSLIALAAVPYLSTSLSKVLTIISLLVIAIGVGGIKPTISSFGGDQFKIPEQLAQLTMFFSIYYFSINIGSGLSTIVTPMIRKDVHCLGQDTCYSLAFGVPAGLIFLALIVFLFGKNLYQVKPITESVLVNTMKCIAYAIGNKRSNKKHDHWLDVAGDKYSASFIKDIKSLFQIIIVFSPLPIFWALWTQMGSTWIFQASRMNGQISGSVIIKPDQTQFINPVLCLILIPFFETVIYPFFGKCSLLLNKPLQKIGTGCVLLAISFVMAGMLEIELQKSYPVLPTNLQNSYNIINTFPCKLTVQLDPVFTSNSDVQSSAFKNYTGNISEYDNLFFDKIAAVDYNMTIHSDNCILNGTNVNFTTKELLPQPGQVHTIVITKSKKRLEGTNFASQTREDLTKSLEGNAKLRIQAINMIHPKFIVSFNSTGRNYTFQFISTDGEILTTELEPNGYQVYFYETGKNESKSRQIGIIELQSGESSLIVIATDLQHNTSIWMKKIILTEPNHIHMLWIIPQYVVQTLAEVFVVPTGYQFAYEQAPLSMKALIQSVWLLTTAGGHLIVIFVTTLNIFSDQAVEFFTFAGIMGIGTVIFIYLAKEYKMLHHDPSIMDPVRRRLSVVQSIATNIG